MPDDDTIIEAMARAMCEADGNDPDQVYDGKLGWKFQAYLINARRQLAAHRAMIKAEKEQNDA